MGKEQERPEFLEEKQSEQEGANSSADAAQ